jgi:hypothetical protein
LFLKGIGSAESIKDSVRAWRFQLIWSTGILGRDEDEKHDSDRYDDSLRATKSWDHRAITEPVERAFVSDDGGTTFSTELKQVASTVGDLYVPGINKTRYLPVCSYTRNQLTVAAATLKFPGYVNSDSCTIDGLSVSAGQALCIASNISQVKRFETYRYRTVSFQFMIKEEGWDDVLLNRGFYVFLDFANPTARTNLVKARALVRNGQTVDLEERPYIPPSEPVTLNEFSEHEDWFKLYHPSDPFVPHWRHFRHLNRTAYSSLGFT